MRVADIARRNPLDDAESVTEFLTTLVKRIDMRILAGPLVGEELAEDDKRGWSGVVILYESHAAVHTYPELGELFLDVFSCKVFSIETVHEVLESFLDSYRVVEQSQFSRGVHWGVDAGDELRRWTHTRKC